MTIEEVERRINLIQANTRDYEVAHHEEDKLREDVLKAIANGSNNAQQLAQLTLKTSEIHFPRYSA
jgi:septum formation topological specificity factor MinE